MQYRRTHNLLTKNMFNSIDPNLIDAVNEKMDNVPEYMKLFTRFQDRKLANQGYQKDSKYNNPMDIFQLTKQSHRKYGHDMLSATLLGMVEARKRGFSPAQGALASFSHAAADSFSNYLIKQFGVEGRTMWEALFLWSHRNKNKYY